MRILGSLSIKQFIYDDLADLVLPASQIIDFMNDEVENPSNFRFQLAQHMENFVKKVAQVLAHHHLQLISLLSVEAIHRYL